MPRRSWRFFAAIFFVSLSQAAVALDNGVALTPPMGWNTFNCWGGEWDDARIKSAADALVSTGLRDVGYIYCNMDGNDNGLTPYWPSYPGFVAWAKPLADYFHSKGLRCGVYITYIDSLHSMKQMASDMIAAGIDFLKHDEYWLETSNPKWRRNLDTLLASGWKGVYSIHAGYNQGDPSLCHMWRTGNDIGASWASVMQNYDANYLALSRSGPGGWADPDMMEVGNISNLTESRAHFSMWCMMAAPLLIGYDITRTTAPNFSQIIAILSNIELIAINQDSLGKPGRRIKGQNTMEVWIKELKDGTKAVALFNRTGSAANGSISQTELGWGSAAQIYVRDLWAHQNVAPFSGTFTRSVASHAAEVFRMSTSPITPVTAMMQKMDRSIAWLRRNGVELFPQRLEPSVLAGMTPVKAFDARGRAIMVRPDFASFMTRQSPSVIFLHLPDKSMQR